MKEPKKKDYRRTYYEDPDVFEYIDKVAPRQGMTAWIRRATRKQMERELKVANKG